MVNGDGLAFGYAAGFKSSLMSGEARMKEQLVALKQLSSACSRLLASYMIFGKPLAIKAARDLHGPAAAAIHGKKLLARGGKDAMHVRQFFLFLYTHACVSEPFFCLTLLAAVKRQLVPGHCQLEFASTCRNDLEVLAAWI